MTSFIGIDPGISGGVACFRSKGGLEWVLPTPTLYADGKHEYNVRSMAGLLRGAGGDSTLWNVVIEQQQGGIFARKKNSKGESMSMGGVSAFNFGKGYGCWIGILEALECRYTLVRPDRWKRDMGLAGTGKSGSRELAVRLFPDFDLAFKRVSDHGVAEAALIAEWGRRHLS